MRCFRGIRALSRDANNSMSWIVQFSLLIIIDISWIIQLTTFIAVCLLLVRSFLTLSSRKGCHEERTLCIARFVRFEIQKHINRERSVPFAPWQQVRLFMYVLRPGLFMPSSMKPSEHAA